MSLWEWRKNVGSSTRIGLSVPAPGASLCVFLSLRYGKIVSTKAILDKTTNKCKGEKTAALVLGSS